MEGISKAIQRLNNGKVAGSDGIHPEFLTCAVLQSNQCSSYRPISLLSVPGKVFVNVLLSRLVQLLTSHRRPNQSSFSTGRSKVDVILAVRLLAEIHRAPLPAFECRLHRHEVGLWVTAWTGMHCGKPCSQLALLLSSFPTSGDLHTGTPSRVRVAGRTSTPFLLLQACTRDVCLFTHCFAVLQIGS